MWVWPAGMFRKKHKKKKRKSKYPDDPFFHDSITLSLVNKETKGIDFTLCLISKTGESCFVWCVENKRFMTIEVGPGLDTAIKKVLTGG